MMPPDLPPATSASQLVTYVTCPRKYAFRYVLGLSPEFRSTSLVLGSVVHGAVGWWYEERREGRTPSRGDVERIVAADLAAETAGVPVRWKDDTPEALEAEAKRLLATYLDRYAEEEVAAAEVPFQVDLEDPDTGEVRGRPLKGYFDFVLARDAVVELKTSSRGWREDDLVRHLQVGAYAYAHMLQCGGMSNVEVRVLVKLKREPRIETYHVARGEPAVRWFLMAAWAIEDAIASRHFPPAPGPLCAECEYASACAAWLARPRELVPAPVVSSLPLVDGMALLAL